MTHDFSPELRVGKWGKHVKMLWGQDPPSVGTVHQRSDRRNIHLVHLEFDGHLAQTAVHGNYFAKFWVEIILQQRRPGMPQVRVGTLTHPLRGDHIEFLSR